MHVVCMCGYVLSVCAYVDMSVCVKKASVCKKKIEKRIVYVVASWLTRITRDLTKAVSFRRIATVEQLQLEYTHGHKHTS